MLIITKTYYITNYSFILSDLHVRIFSMQFFCDFNLAKPRTCTLADSGFFKNFLYQGGVKSTVSWVFEDLKFKTEGYDQNWCFPDSAQLVVSAKLRQLSGQSQENTNLGPNLLKF